MDADIQVSIEIALVCRWAVKMINFALNMMNSVFKMIHSAFVMIDLGQRRRGHAGGELW